MATYKTPGVYIEEISTLPASIVRVETAVPAFIGYVETATHKGKDLTNVPTKIRSLKEYEEYFGGEPTDQAGRGITVVVDESTGAVSSVSLAPKFLLYHSLRHFYLNGGGDAYIVAVGTYEVPSGMSTVSNDVDKEELKGGIDALKKSDAPTLLVLPDAFKLSTAHMGEVQAYALAHCNTMQDRFGIFDVQSSGSHSADVTEFRTRIGTQYLKYGAAYYPPLHTTLGPNTALDDSLLTIQRSSDNAARTLTQLAASTGDAGIQDFLDSRADEAELTADITINTVDRSFSDWVENLRTAIDAVAADISTIPTASPGDEKAYLLARVQELKGLAGFLYADNGAAHFANGQLDEVKEANLAPDSGNGDLEALVRSLYIVDQAYAEITPTGGPFTALGEVVPADFNTASYDYALGGIAAGTITAEVEAIYGTGPQASEAAAVQAAVAYLESILDGLEAIYEAWTKLVEGRTYAALETSSTVYSGIIKAVRSEGYVLPPAAAIAGIYSAVDADRGVWKAPANVSVNGIQTEPATLFASDYDDLNVPSDGQGKSINAIRFFRGKGTLVYGARTLAGNDAEWRYVPVRRLFIMVEESVKKATESLVFEPNDANTWQKTKAMIENFLIDLWKDGALAGPTAESAFFVKIGLNETMTPQDILDGKLIVEIGMAAVRPAEFILLRFSHKLQEA